MATRIRDFDINGIAAEALVSVPRGEGPFPGVVVTFHREGLDEFTEWKVDRLAEAGFAAIAPGHYHALPPGVGFLDRRGYLSDEQMALDIKSAAEWLRQQKNVDPNHLAVLGPCMGGRTTLVALECYPELWMCACIWYGGECFKPMAGKLAPPADIERLRLIQCPIEGFFGGRDTNPPPAEVDKLDELLASIGKQHVFHRYPDAGHGFLNPWHKNYNEAAARHSWGLALTFLKHKLMVQPAATK